MKKQILAITCLLGTFFCFNGNDAFAKELNVKASKTEMLIGEQMQMQGSLSGCRYKSNNTAVAVVNENGCITAKKAGKVSIVVSKKGYTTKNYWITVNKTKKRPEIPVAIDEVRLQDVMMNKGEDGQWNFSAVIQNNAEKGKIKKISYYYDIKVKKTVLPKASDTAALQSPEPTNLPDDSQKGLDGIQTSSVEATPAVTQNPASTPDAAQKPDYEIVEKEVVLSAKNIKAKKSSARVKCQGDMSGKVQEMKLKKIVLYTGNAKLTYFSKTKKLRLEWGTKDTTAPKISGWVGKNSAYDGVELFSCYSDQRKTYSFTKHVNAVDERDGKVKVHADTSLINWNKEGIYKIVFIAKDKAGNQAKAYARIHVYKPGTAESVADEVLRSITQKSWSDEKKLRAIYRYAKGRCSYVDNNTHNNWRNTALRGIRYQSGDCFTFYSIVRLLTTRAGIPNLKIKRYPAYPARHWWNLVYVRGGWYHLDATPRARDGRFCLVTDAQLRTYSTGSTFRFRKELYPKRASKRISSNP